jgi:dethiobiotin synthetase
MSITNPLSTTIFVAGTDVAVGKTVLLSALAAYWQTYRSPQSLGIMKLIEQGTGDRDWYHTTFVPNQPAEVIAPCSISGAAHATEVNLGHLWQTLCTLAQQTNLTLVEGLGGLGCPIAPETTVADLAWDWRLPTVLVVPVRPNAIAHAVANVALARQARVHLKGLVLNNCQPDSQVNCDEWMPLNVLRSLTQVPILGCLPYLTDPSDRAALAQAAAGLALEHLLPTAQPALIP